MSERFPSIEPRARLTRLSDAELIEQLANQAKELGILFAQWPRRPMRSTGHFLGVVCTTPAITVCPEE
jgi:hypothetical protein